MARGKPFEKGKSGNPGGRPKEIGDIKKIARENAQVAIDALIDVAKKGPASARVAAATALLDRGYGKPTQPVSGDGGGSLAFTFVLNGDTGNGAHLKDDAHDSASLQPPVALPSAEKSPLRP